MDTELDPNGQEQKRSIMVSQSGGDAVYGIGLFGAWAYYLSQANTFQQGLLGFLKGFVWPAILVYELLKFLNKEQEIQWLGANIGGGLCVAPNAHQDPRQKRGTNE